MNRIDRSFRLILMLTFLVLISTVVASCVPGQGIEPETVAKHLAEVQRHPFPPHSVGKFSVRSPLQQEKATVEIWSEGTDRIRMEFKEGENAGDYNVSNDGKTMEYHHSDNTYTVTDASASGDSQAVGSLTSLVKSFVESKDFHYDGIGDVAGRKAYKVEISSNDDFASGFDKIILSVDAEYWTLLSLEAKSPGVVVSWRAIEVDFNTPTPENLFTLSPPESAKKVEPAWQAGIRRLASLEEAERYLGYRLLVPQWLPEGYKLVEINAVEGDKPIVGMLYRKRALTGMKELTVSEIAVGAESGSLRGIDNCRNEQVEVHGQAAVYSKCELGSSIEWRQGNLLVAIEGFENEKTLLKVAGLLK